MINSTMCLPLKYLILASGSHGFATVPSGYSKESKDGVPISSTVWRSLVYESRIMVHKAATGSFKVRHSRQLWQVH